MDESRAPSAPATISRGRILEIRPLAESTFLMVIDCPAVAATAEPGQFVKARTWDESAGPLLDRPFSIHRVVDGRLELLFRAVGPATNIMAQSRAGDRIKITGPLGRGLTDLHQFNQGLYLVGGGIGLAPMGMVLDRVDYTRTRLFYGERAGGFQVDENWLKSWAGKYEATCEDGGGYGEKGLVTAPLERALAKEIKPVFACGPAPMLAAVVKTAGNFGAPCLVSLEAGMACGLGVCLTCSLPLKDGGRIKVCQDGPVVDGGSVDWERVRR
ncbi:hypothetical protein LJB99_03755 [Deltaproteobacteria bacterium OttesenSCG-928-K17]|nr:hypothetical protein [Deltaproteobacteria bacterium OttesenSCG-928-K17]